MAFERPTFQQIRDRVLGDIDATLGTGPYSRATVEYALANAMAGVCHMLFGAIEIAKRSTVPDTAESAVMLRWAAFFGITRRPPTSNKGHARWPAVPSATLPSGTIVRLRDGTEYAVDATVAASGGFVTASLTAVVKGVAGRAIADAAITLGSPVAGVSPQGLVIAPGLKDGTDSETPRSVLARLVARLRRPPRGGGPGDYQAWALEVPGVTRAWEYTPYTTPAVAPGSVRLLFVTDDDPNGAIPSAEKVAEVEAYINARRPVTVANFRADGPKPLAQSFAIEVAIEDDAVLASVREAARANVRALIQREAEPGKRLALSRISEAVSTAAGEYSHEIISPTSDIEPAVDYLIVFDDIVWS